jgi:hypothetical protein
LSALTGAIALAVSLVSLTSTSQSAAQAGPLFNILNGGGYYGGGYGPGYGTYSPYGYGPYGYGSTPGYTYPAYGGGYSYPGYNSGPYGYGYTQTYRPTVYTPYNYGPYGYGVRQSYYYGH